jgi:Ca-activated chloride channel family protein
MKNFYTVIGFLLFFFQLQAQTPVPSPIMFIYDASGSMWGEMDGKTKKEIAAEVLSNTIGDLTENQAIGLIAYGHRKKGDCQDVEFLSDLNNTSKAQITEAISAIKPLGKTPLAYSATLAFNSLKKTKTNATIILITDGIESCDGDLCAVVMDAKKEGLTFKLHIVGFGLEDGDAEALKCAAANGDGNYYDARNANDLKDVLTEVTAKTIDEPKDNFSLYAVKNGEPVDTWVKAKSMITGEEIKGVRTYRDTAKMYLPAGIYELQVNPLEGTDIPGTKITVNIAEGESKHKDISFDGGILKINTTNNGEGWDAIVKLHDINNNKVLASLRTYGREKPLEYLAGKYKLSFQALAIEGLETYYEMEPVEIKAGKDTPVNHEFETGKALIGVRTASGELIDAMININESKTGTRVAGGRSYTSPKSNPKEFILNPGSYSVKIQTLGVHKGNTETIEIIIKKGETSEKILDF